MQLCSWQAEEILHLSRATVNSLSKGHFGSKVLSLAIEGASFIAHEGLILSVGAMSSVYYSVPPHPISTMPDIKALKRLQRLRVHIKGSTSAHDHDKATYARHAY